MSTTRALTAGVRAGAVLAAFAILFAILGLTPSLSWIPEVPLLTVAGVLPVAVLTVMGYRTWKSSGVVLMGAIAGATAGGIGGCVGGVAYVAFGKSPFNIVAGTIVGVAAGLALGTLGAVAAARRA
ncbi:MAG TPA: hypothetical protein VGU71_12190 [Candidatus Dormibacteraeota bacterium]|nr:hypothetical protein [Candidatus Dormibacteraeota bacterium]